MSHGSQLPEPLTERDNSMSEGLHWREHLGAADGNCGCTQLSLKGIPPGGLSSWWINTLHRAVMLELDILKNKQRCVWLEMGMTRNIEQQGKAESEVPLVIKVSPCQRSHSPQQHPQPLELKSHWKHLYKLLLTCANAAMPWMAQLMAGVCCTDQLETRLVSFLPWGFRKLGTEIGSSLSPLQPPDANTLLFFTSILQCHLGSYLDKQASICLNINLWAIAFDSWTGHGQAPSAAGWTWAEGNRQKWCIVTADLEESLYCVPTVTAENN